ncbi:putative membrane protein [Antricoccus suffuscus]|uniref:Putative membrane protein n=1 Tax=Antricoccus suffuscus TaxID=1629062 RepID=A0A2T1A112_9ACTN|nr:phage holin family protein [Antricoccus suffuscus]PRZ42291.1 putative membrane protein [Antricoccus suffuscus]
MRILARIIATALATALAAWLVSGITLGGGTDQRKILTLVCVAVIIGIVNAVVRPIVTVLSGCIVVLTLGLFLLVINALMLLLSSWVAGKLGLGFHVDGFWPALWGSIIISIVSGAIYAVLRPHRDDRSANHH